MNISKENPAVLLRNGHFQPETLVPDETEVLQILFQRESISRAEIAELTGWSRQRVYQRMHQLADRGLVEELEGDPSANRKKPGVFRIVRDKAYLAGMEIQKSGLQIYLSDITGELLQERSESIGVDRSPGEILSSASQLLAGMIADVQEGRPVRLAGIAVSVQGLVDATNTWIVHSSSLAPSWEFFDIRNDLQGRFPSASVIVESDVNITALSEQRLLPGPGTKDLVYIQIGEDIRAGIVLAGNLHRGSDDCAGQIGHICVDEAGPLCSCGNTGCLNTVASEAALVMSASGAVQTRAHHEKLSINDIFRASLEGDPAALALLQAAGNQIGEVTARLVTFFNPDHIAIGCDASTYDNRFLVSVRRAIYKHALPLATANITIDFARANGAARNHILLFMRDYLFGGYIPA